MPDSRGPMLRVDPEKLKHLVVVYENAANRVYRIIDHLGRQGRIGTPWTGDQISTEMANHYNTQIFEGAYSTYASIVQYEMEMRTVARTLRKMLDGYETTEAEAATAFQMQSTLPTGRF